VPERKTHLRPILGWFPGNGRNVVLGSAIPGVMRSVFATLAGRAGLMTKSPIREVGLQSEADRREN
jgi:hypothetical protein